MLRKVEQQMADTYWSVIVSHDAHLLLLTTSVQLSDLEISVMQLIL